MIHHFVSGMVLGLSAGLSPGPLLALVVSESLAHGRGAGFRVAMSPLITDLPIVLAALFLLSELSGFNMILGGISLAGSVVILKMGMENFRSEAVEEACCGAEPRSLAKGVMVNFLSPHPYIFWLSVGAPLTIRAWTDSPWAALGFVGMFYLMLIGSKICLALLTAGSKEFISGRPYLYTMRTLGGLLCLLGLVLAWEGITLLGLV